MIFWKDFQLDDALGSFLILPEQRMDQTRIMEDARNKVLGSTLIYQDSQMDPKDKLARMVSENKGSEFENSKRHESRADRSNSKKRYDVRSGK